MEILLSVIVPIYNVEKYIKKCVQSLINQDVENTEYILVNDGTKDNSIKICYELVKNDPRFKIINKENGGLVSAWKRGVESAKGKYIGFVDSDDWIESNMFSVLLKEIIETDCDIVCSGAIAESQNGEEKYCSAKRELFCEQQVIEDFLKIYCFPWSDNNVMVIKNRWDKIYKKELLINNMSFFNENISLGEDINANIAMILDAKKILVLSEFAPYHYVYNPKSIVNTYFDKNVFSKINKLANTCNEIAKQKNYSDDWIKTFIGSMVFYEIINIFSGKKYSKEDISSLKKQLRKFNFKNYLNLYKRKRNKFSTSIFVFFINIRFFAGIKILCKIYKRKK